MAIVRNITTTCFFQTNDLFHDEMDHQGASVSLNAPQTYDAVWAIALALSRAELMWRTLEDNNGTRKGTELGLGHFDYDRKDMAEEFLNQMANLSFMGVSVSTVFLINYNDLYDIF